MITILNFSDVKYYIRYRIIDVEAEFVSGNGIDNHLVGDIGWQNSAIDDEASP